MIAAFFKWLASLFGPRPEPQSDDPIGEEAGVATGIQHTTLAWGRKVSAEFREAVLAIAERLRTKADYLMAVMAFETGYTFSPSVKNMAGSGATGLIQFMPKTAIDMGTTVNELAHMSDVEQLKYVEQYFRPYAGRLDTLSDVYMAVLWPRAIGKPEDYVLWDDDTRPLTYKQNIGLDGDKDGAVTKAEAAGAVLAAYKRGMQEANMWEGYV